MSNLRVRDKQAETWAIRTIRTVIEVKSERVIKGKAEKATRYYLTSKIGAAEYFAKNIRGHWGIENHLHYVIDVAAK